MQELKIQIPKEMLDPAQIMSINEPVSIEGITTGPDTYIFSEPCDLNITITNTGGALLVLGIVSGKASTACSRCLEEADVHINGSVEGYILIDGQQSGLDDLEGDEYEVLGEDRMIDLMPFIVSAILLDLPRTPLCSDDCKGICPKCGCNLNVEECSCKDDASIVDDNNPFAILKQLDLGN